MHRKVHPQAQRRPSRAFTIVELLVVIAIIGVLVALLLPAVQAAREAARRTQCSNHLKQMGLAALNHHSVHRFFPSCGWGNHWVGDPDCGFGEQQPGGWIFQLLPYLEQQPLFDLGAGLTGTAKTDALGKMTATPIAMFNCPSRRAAVPYTAFWNGGFNARNAAKVPGHARSDYAVNGGASGAVNEVGPVDSAWTGWSPVNKNKLHSGVSYIVSKVSLSDIRDGASNTYFAAEKYLNPDHYTDGQDPADNLSMYEGQDWDVVRWTFISYAPLQDQQGIEAPERFGSAHASVFQAVFCDGSVHNISYAIDPEMHRRYGDRKDGLVVVSP